MEVFEQKGICINSSLVIDPANGSNADTVLISHAHSDHVHFNGKNSVLCSKPTLSLIEQNFKKAKNALPLKNGKKIEFDEFTLSVHNSGHILGSVQALIEGNKSIAVTSDFKLQDSLIQKGAVPLHCDTLVIESTFGLPDYSFPPRSEVYERMALWIKKNIKKNNYVLLAGYSTGKAQELTAFCNAFLGIVPLVHERVYNNNKVYEKHGVSLGEYIKLDHNLQDSSILIMPPALCSRHLVQALQFSLNKRVVCAKATGWNYRHHFDEVFPLSDHADFNQLIEYIKQAEPKNVLTMHGFARELASSIKRKLKIPARPLESRNYQQSLPEFV